MYEYMKGMVTAINPYYIVIEVNQIGYQIAVANPFRYSSSKGSEIQIYLHQIVREDSHLLYGFASLEEKQLFLKLVSVSGIGAKSALAIMASGDHSGLVRAIEAQDVTYLVQFPGVGKKTAQQMILDLKDKLGDVDLEAVQTTEGTTVQEDLFEPVDATALNEAIEALRALGYSEREVTKLKKELEAHPSHTTDEYLRLGLKLLMKK